MTRKELTELRIPEFRTDIFHIIKDHWNHVAKPLDGLGYLETALCTVGAVQETDTPELNPRALIIMCADNGIVRQGISQSGQEVTLAVARNMGQRRSSVCKMARIAGTQVIPVDIGINSDEKPDGVLDRKIRKGTGDFSLEPAMTEAELLQAIETGIRLVKECREQGIRILATGEMGIGNTTTSAAVAAALLHLPSEITAGRGAGLDNAGLGKKQKVIREAVQRYEQEWNLTQNSAGTASGRERAFYMLRCMGGLDIAGLCGVFIGGALFRVPVIADGVISAVAALCAARLVPGCENAMLASHIGAEPAMKYILEELGLTPVIHGGLKLGEGTGAVMMFPLLDMALEVYRESSSFDEIGVSQYERYHQ